MTWSIRLSIGIFMYLVLILKWSEHPLSVWPLWMWARVISAHDAPKQLWVSNMIQRIVPNSLVAAAYILIISREPDRCGGSGGLRQHERYQSLAFRWLVMLVHSEVTYDIMDSLWGARLQFPILTRRKVSCALCVLPHMYTSAFFFFLILLNPVFLQQFVSLIQTQSLAFIWKLMLPWSEKFRILYNIWSRRDTIVCASLNHCSWSGRLLFFHTIHSVYWKHFGQNLSFPNQWPQSQ